MLIQQVMVGGHILHFSRAPRQRQSRDHKDMEVLGKRPASVTVCPALHTVHRGRTGMDVLGQ